MGTKLAASLRLLHHDLRRLSRWMRFHGIISRPRHRESDAGHSLQRLRRWLRLERLYRRYGRVWLLFRLGLIQRVHVAHAGNDEFVIAQPQAVAGRIVVALLTELWP